MATVKQDALEPHARHIGGVMLIENGDSSWSIGTDLKTAVKVKFEASSFAPKNVRLTPLIVTGSCSSGFTAESWT